MNDNPKIRWHANGEGKCHGECEQKNKPNNSQSGCGVVDRLPWYTKLEAVPIGAPCPFAVLGDVFALHERTPDEEKPNEDRQCGTCVWMPMMDGGVCAQGLVFGQHNSPGTNCRFWGPRT